MSGPDDIRVERYLGIGARDLLRTARWTNRAHVAYEQLDVEYREKVRYEHTDCQGELERILVSAEGERHMMGARTVNERQLGDARTVDEVAHEEAEDEVKGHGSPVEASHALGRPRQHHLLDVEQQQILRGDVMHAVLCFCGVIIDPLFLAKLGHDCCNVCYRHVSFSSSYW